MLGTFAPWVRCISLAPHDFDRLREYSCSIPTGTTEGVQWKRRVGYMRNHPRHNDWLLGEYTPCTCYPLNPKCIHIRWLPLGRIGDGNTHGAVES